MWNFRIQPPHREVAVEPSSAWKSPGIQVRISLYAVIFLMRHIMVHSTLRHRWYVRYMPNTVLQSRVHLSQVTT